MAMNRRSAATMVWIWVGHHQHTHWLDVEGVCQEPRPLLPPQPRRRNDLCGHMVCGVVGGVVCGVWCVVWCDVWCGVWRHGEWLVAWCGAWLGAGSMVEDGSCWVWGCGREVPRGEAKEVAAVEGRAVVRHLLEGCSSSSGSNEPSALLPQVAVG
jgi:hypothetical protein